MLSSSGPQQSNSSSGTSHRSDIYDSAQSSELATIVEEIGSQRRKSDESERTRLKYKRRSPTGIGCSSESSGKES
eukprot:scaffold17131_cov35-Prasinocladus_malaysianus.AAC.1